MSNTEQMEDGCFGNYQQEPSCLHLEPLSLIEGVMEKTCCQPPGFACETPWCETDVTAKFGPFATTVKTEAASSDHIPISSSLRPLLPVL
ncbi:hypothetical protein GN956_G16377 [Arapaima gigas]